MFYIVLMIMIAVTLVAAVLGAIWWEWLEKHHPSLDD